MLGKGQKNLSLCTVKWHHLLVMSKRYKTQGGADLIEVNIREVQQLFDSRDPAPFRERDLDDDFVDYVVACAKELPAQHPIKILIHLMAPRPVMFQSKIVLSEWPSNLFFPIRSKCNRPT